MTPLQDSLPPSSGDCSETVISAHSWNGVGLRNSMPLLWMETVSADNSKRSCRASTVIFCSNEPLSTNLFALINSIHTSTLPESVKLADSIYQISSPFDHRRAPR